MIIRLFNVEYTEDLHIIRLKGFFTDEKSIIEL